MKRKRISLNYLTSIVEQFLFKRIDLLGLMNSLEEVEDGLCDGLYKSSVQANNYLGLLCCATELHKMNSISENTLRSILNNLRTGLRVK